MKKLLAILPAIAMLTACNSAPVTKINPTQVHATLENAKSYTCDNNARILAVYGKNTANVRVTAPTLQLDQAALILNQDMKNTAISYGASTSDKSTQYNWMPTPQGGILAVNYKGTAYNFTCQIL